MIVVIKKFRKWIAERLLSGRGNERTPKVYNLADSRTIGILFDATKKEDLDLVKKYVAYLHEMNKNVKALGYVDSKDLPEGNYSKFEYAFVGKKDLTFFMKPQGAQVEDFIKGSYDVLIDLNIYNCFPLRYIAVTCNAKFKIGYLCEKNKVSHDMLIEAEPSKGLKYLLRQVDVYFAMINSKSFIEN